MFGKCQKCKKVGWMQKHHKYPRRFFGDKNNPERVILCDSCHKGIERLIPRYEKQSRSWYEKLTDSFLNN